GKTGSYRLAGGLFGGTFGYNLQAGNTSWVVGAEADLGWSTIKGTLPPNIAPELAGFDPVTGASIFVPTPICVPNCEVSNPWLATARLRLGYSFGLVMPYVTAGVAVGRLQANISGIPAGPASSDNLRSNAWAGTP